MGGPTTVIWRGVRVDPRTAAMLDEVGRLTPTLPTLAPSQGSYNTSVGASAGTHAGGGAVDIRCSNLTAAQAIETVRVMRLVGFAAWRRMPHEGDWPEHIHGIAVGQRDLSPAAARQVDALRAGRNGLANNGPDPHRTLGLPVTTWEAYKNTGGTMTPDQEKRLHDKLDQLRHLRSTETGNQVLPATAWSHLKTSLDRLTRAVEAVPSGVLSARIANVDPSVPDQRGTEAPLSTFVRYTRHNTSAGVAAQILDAVEALSDQLQAWGAGDGGAAQECSTRVARIATAVRRELADALTVDDEPEAEAVEAD